MELKKAVKVGLLILLGAVVLFVAAIVVVMVLGVECAGEAGKGLGF